jgi:hypothetical protein
MTPTDFDLIIVGGGHFRGASLGPQARRYS